MIFQNIHGLHSETRELLERLLSKLANEGEEVVLKYIKEEVLSYLF